MPTDLSSCVGDQSKGPLLLGINSSSTTSSSNSEATRGEGVLAKLSNTATELSDGLYSSAAASATDASSRGEILPARIATVPLPNAESILRYGAASEENGR